MALLHREVELRLDWTGPKVWIRETLWEHILLFQSINFRGRALPRTCQPSDWSSKDFHRDQEAANVDGEERERAVERGNKRMGGEPKRINRRIKEILIWSERLLIFSSGPTMCTQPVISLETKKREEKVECGESCGLCVYSLCVCVCVCG